MKQIYVLQGVSGSGKSTWAKVRAYEAIKQGRTVAICSADMFFEDALGVYTFDASKLSEAHAACFRDYIGAVTSDVDLIIVDNTNTTTMEVSPYFLAAQSINLHNKEVQPEGESYRIQILRFDCPDLSVALARNKHGTPIKAIQGQAERIERFDKENYLGWPVEALV